MLDTELDLFNARPSAIGALVGTKRTDSVRLSDLLLAAKISRDLALRKLLRCTVWPDTDGVVEEVRRVTTSRGEDAQLGPVEKRELRVVVGEWSVELVPDSESGRLSLDTELIVWHLTSESREADLLVPVQFVFKESLDMIVLEREDCLRLGATKLSRERPIELMLFVEEPLMGRFCVSRLSVPKFSTDCVESRVLGSR